MMEKSCYFLWEAQETQMRGASDTNAGRKQHKYKV